MESEYLKLLSRENPVVAERYRSKLAIINDLDPFSLEDQDLDHSSDNLQSVGFLDIAAYLTLSHSFYTNQQMKAYKSLQAYKYFEAGFVLKAGTKYINNLCILVGKVKHSQRANEKCLDVWIILQKDGSVLTAHCTCMAGSAEVCSHVGALLFAAEFAFRSKEEGVSSTDTLCTWNMPSASTTVPVLRVREINWGRTSVSNSYPGMKNIAPLTKEEKCNILKEISDLGLSSAMMRVVEPFATKISEQTKESSIAFVFDVFDEANINKSHIAYEDVKNNRF
ncbi:uncharacterized protein LOC123321995 [Coccinella septempunctata]|uniref:uncharacterized protein LOC123321995 n=1 Tax=Coccinella septempunctata TaxID=41139 RepID=UPI001D068FB5|nr:uncharacterized protein LOC123321995 [Coccinella septempunctata]